jgi:glycogen debranching enzyme
VYTCLILSLILISCEKKEKTGMVKIPPGLPAGFATELPRPFFAQQQYLSDLYWKSWNLLQDHVHSGKVQNGFVDKYLDEGFNEYIYQWDTCFMAMFAMYGFEAFPAMASLDNFYRKQRQDGWICRVYRESDGTAVEQPSRDEPMINPPLFAWVEWKYFLLTGDKSRFRQVLPALDAYFRWIDENCRGEARAQGLFYYTHLGSGMDNSPREGIARAGWLDLSAQMALFAKYMMLMAGEAGERELSGYYEQRYRLISRLINSLMWDGIENFYFDIDQMGQRISTKTVAAFWPLVAEVASFPQARQLEAHLQNPREFNRFHMFPTLSADHPLYDPRGHYWCGGVWAPINYMIIKGLDMYPLQGLAAVASINHIKNMRQVFDNFYPDSSQLAPQERDGNYQTIWECYAPDYPEPATRWDGRYLSRQDFVGWSGLGPIALLLEDIVGLQPSAPDDKLHWNLRLNELHGVENYRFGDNQCDIVCESNNLPVGEAVLRVNSNSPFILVVSSQIGIRNFQVRKGENVFNLKL